MTLPLDLKQRFVELRAAGLSFNKIAAALGVSKPTTLKWSDELGKEIASEEYARAEEILQKHRIYRQARLEDVIGDLARIREAIKKRNLAKVNFSTLMELEEKRHAEITSLVTELQKSAGLKGDGQKPTLTRSMIDEILYETLGVPPPKFPGSEKNEENPQNTLKPD